MEQRLKELVKRLGKAIDASLSQSEAIGEVIQQIKEEGYDVLLVLEATIGLNQSSKSASERAKAIVAHQDLDSSLTEQDQKFLKALSISLDD